MNRNEYRRALIMLRSMKSGVSGYVRLERRTLMGTLQFTINGAQDGGELYAILLADNGGALSAVRLARFAAPRYGQTGLVWKFDPRNIENRTLEQYHFAAVVEIREGVCELLLCGNLNGSAEADWIQVRDAACRLFTPVRISGAPISPIDEKRPEICPCHDDGIQTLPEYNEDFPANPGTDSEVPAPVEPREEPDAETGDSSPPDIVSAEPENSSAEESGSSPSLTAPETDSELTGCCGQPSAPVHTEPDELDTPAMDEPFLTAARAAYAAENEPDSPVPDELDTPAQDDFPSDTTAGEQLSLTDPNAAWPESIEPLRALFFSSERIVPFEMEEYVFIRAPLPDNNCASSCLIGLYCENGMPERVCYAIPAAYSPEPPAGMEGYVWKGDHTRGYWVICEETNA